MIVLDGHSITDELSGIGRYALGLLSGLARVGCTHPITVVGGLEQKVLSAAAGIGDFTFVPQSAAAESIGGQARLALLLRRLRARVFHAPALGAPLLPTRAKIIITVHDLIPQRMPEGLARSRKVRHARLWRTWCRMNYRCADAIVTVSDHSRRELIEHEELLPEKVHRIYNGVDAPTKDGGGEAFRERFAAAADRPIISYVGRHDPYKNVEALIGAFERVHALHPEAMLVIAGKPDDRYPEARHAARRSPAAEAILFTGYLRESVRCDLLRQSAIFVFPSRYEGFGLPPLEAMAAGVPVVASSATSLPEVLGDAAILVDPDDIGGFADSIARLLQDAPLRARMIEAGRAQAAKFTWQRCAVEHLALYERLMQA